MITCSFSLRRRALLLHDAETAFHDIVENIGLLVEWGFRDPQSIPFVTHSQ
jgi:hypothetical protein